MTSVNDITGDLIKSRSSNDKYREGWERIFGNKEEVPPPAEEVIQEAEPVVEEEKPKEQE